MAERPNHVLSPQYGIHAAEGAFVGDDVFADCCSHLLNFPEIAHTIATVTHRLPNLLSDYLQLNPFSRAILGELR